MPLIELNHVTIRTKDMEATRAFFGDVLGLHPGWRPDLGFPGYWLYCGNRPVIHVVPPGQEIGGGDADETGNLDHVAFLGQDIDELRERLVKSHTTFRERYIPDGQRRQIFLFDPNSVLIELNFPNLEKKAAE
jgi:catechol 2,3-dioxygenase-like lactoylglutathione lyase family enzyme